MIFTRDHPNLHCAVSPGESWAGSFIGAGGKLPEQHREGTAAKCGQVIIQMALSVYAQLQSLPALYKPIMDPAWMILCNFITAIIDDALVICVS